MAAEMDAHIRAETDGQKSLKDGLPNLLEEATGVDVSTIYARWMMPR